MGSIPFDEGMFAFQTAKRKSTNPYPVNTQDHNEWNNGYEYARDTEPTD